MKNRVNKRPVKESRANRRSIILAAVVVCVIAGLAVGDGIRLKSRYEAYAKEQQELNDKIATEKARQQELLEYQEYVQSPEFAEEFAREHFGLVRQNEIIIKPE